MDAAFLAAKFAAALPYADYVQTGTPEQQRRWQAVHDAARLTRTNRRSSAASSAR